MRVGNFILNLWTAIERINIRGEEKNLTYFMKKGPSLVGHEHLAGIEKKGGRNFQEGNPGRKLPDSMK